MREISQDPATGPIPLAVAHGADGLQRLLWVIAAGQVLSVEGLRHSLAELGAAQECFEAAIANIDVLPRCSMAWRPSSRTDVGTATLAVVNLLAFYLAAHDSYPSTPSG